MNSITTVRTKLFTIGFFLFIFSSFILFAPGKSYALHWVELSPYQQWGISSYEEDCAGAACSSICPTQDADVECGPSFCSVNCGSSGSDPCEGTVDTSYVTVLEPGESITPNTWVLPQTTTRNITPGQFPQTAASFGPRFDLHDISGGGNPFVEAMSGTVTGTSGNLTVIAGTRGFVDHLRVEIDELATDNDFYDNNDPVPNLWEMPTINCASRTIADATVDCPRWYRRSISGITHTWDGNFYGMGHMLVFLGSPEFPNFEKDLQNYHGGTIYWYPPVGMPKNDAFLKYTTEQDRADYNPRIEDDHWNFFREGKVEIPFSRMVPGVNTMDIKFHILVENKWCKIDTITYTPPDDNDEPNCSLNVTVNRSSGKVVFSLGGTDVTSGIARMGLYYSTISPLFPYSRTGDLIGVNGINNDYVINPPQNIWNSTQTLNISTFDHTKTYRADLNLWDAKGALEYQTNPTAWAAQPVDSNNFVQCQYMFSTNRTPACTIQYLDGYYKNYDDALRWPRNTEINDMRANCSDPDGDTLTYDWAHWIGGSSSCSGDMIYSRYSRNTIYKTLNISDSYCNLRAFATDPYGLTGTDEVSVKTIKEGNINLFWTTDIDRTITNSDRGKATTTFTVSNYFASEQNGEAKIFTDGVGNICGLSGVSCYFDSNDSNTIVVPSRNTTGYNVWETVVVQMAPWRIPNFPHENTYFVKVGFKPYGSTYSTLQDTMDVLNGNGSCSGISYSTNNGSTYTVYNNSLRWPPGAELDLRANCSDPDGDTIEHAWATSCNNAIINNSALDKDAYIEYRIPNFVPNVVHYCTVTTNPDELNSTADTLAVLPNRTITLATLTTGTHFIKQPHVYKDDLTYELGPTINTVYTTYTVSNFDTDTDNRGTAVFNTTSDTISGLPNICKTVADCRFVNSTADNDNNISNDGATTTRTINEIPSGSTVYKIRIRYKNGTPPIDHGGTYKVGINFSVNNTSLTVNPNANIPVTEDPPICKTLSFTPFSPANGDVNVGISLTGDDEWNLLKARLRVTRPNNATFPLTPTNGSGYLAADTTTFNFNWPLNSYGEGNYKFTALLYDKSNEVTPRATCDLSTEFTQGVTGDEPDELGETDIDYLVDKTAPVCRNVANNAAGNGIWVTNSGTDANPVITIKGYDNLSGIANYGIRYQLQTDTSINGYVAGPTTIVPVQKWSSSTYTWSNPSFASKPGGTYNMFVDFVDDAGNQGTCTTTFIKGSRFSAKAYVLTSGITNIISGPSEISAITSHRYMQSRYEQNINTGVGTQYNIVDGTNTSSLTPGTWQNGLNSTNCESKFPTSGNPATSCNAYDISAEAYAPNLATTNRPLARITYDPDRYKCYWRILNPQGGVTISGTDPTPEDGICTTERFNVTPEPSDQVATVERPTKVEFYLDYNIAQVKGKVWNESGDSVGIYDISGTNINPNFNVPPNGEFTVPVGSGPDPMDSYYADGAQPTITLEMTDTPDKICLWAYNSTGASNNGSLSDYVIESYNQGGIQTLVQGLSYFGWKVGQSCTVNFAAQGISIDTDTQSPVWTNELHFFVVPAVQLSGDIYFLPDDNSCSKDWVAEGYGLNTHDTKVSVTSTPSGVSSIIPPDPNFYKATYEYYAPDIETNGALSAWSNWTLTAFPDPDSNFYTGCPSVDTVNVSGTIPNYPSEFEVTKDLAVFVREGNDWWQVYNGGAHSNQDIDLDLPNFSDIEHPEFGLDDISAAPLIGDPRGPQDRPEAFDLTSYLAVDTSYVGGLLTNVDKTGNAINLGSGTPGISGKNWHAYDLTDTFVRPYQNMTDIVAEIGQAAAVAGADWVESSNFGDALVSATGDYVFFNGATSTGTGLANYSGHKFYFINGTLSIDGDISSSSTGDSMVLVVNGDVNISKDVSEIVASVYATGKISIPTGGEDLPSENQLRVQGGLYGNTIDFGRDIENIEATVGVPSHQVIFNPSVIGAARNYPSEVKEINTYWVVRD